ncbi:MAG: Hsp20/alpha crystallin family protein, partial [Planctomycetaceae bacterium]
MTTGSTEEKTTEHKSAEKVRDVVAEWIETVAAQGEKALQALGLGNQTRASGPLADVVETASTVVVTMDLPGVDPQAIEVLLAGNMLTVKGEHQGATAAKGNI